MISRSLPAFISLRGILLDHFYSYIYAHMKWQYVYFNSYTHVEINIEIYWTIYTIYWNIYTIISWNQIAHVILQPILFTYQHVLESFICRGIYLHLILLTTAIHFMLWISHCFPAIPVLMGISTCFWFFHWNQCCNNHSVPTSLWTNTRHFSRQITRTEMD